MKMSCPNVGNTSSHIQEIYPNIFARLGSIDRQKFKIMIETFIWIFGEQTLHNYDVVDEKMNEEEVKLENKEGYQDIDEQNYSEIEDKEEKIELPNLETSDKPMNEKLVSQKDFISKKQYECSNCKETFKKKRNLLKHINSIHTIQNKVTTNSAENNSYDCQHCDKTFSSAVTYENHVKIAHSEKDVNLYGTIEDFEKKETNIICNTCGKELRNKYILATHIKTIHGDEKIKKMKKCNFCEMEFNVIKSNLKIIRHLKNIHTNKDVKSIIEDLEEQENKLVCNICGDKLRGKYYLDSHIKLKHSDLEMAPCHICGKLIKQHDSIIYQHLQSHNDFPCEYCQVVLGSKSAYKRHKVIHMPGFKKIECDECPSQFDRESYLNLHKQRIHSGLNNKNKGCDTCGKMFTTFSKLRYHINAIHLQEKPFCCDLCEYKTARKDNLTTHRKGNHGNENKVTELGKEIFSL